MLVNAMHILEGKLAASDTGLVGDHAEFEPGILQCLQGGTDTGINDNLLGTMQIILVLDERAIPIQKHRAIHGDEASVKAAGTQSVNTILDFAP